MIFVCLFVVFAIFIILKDILDERSFKKKMSHDLKEKEEEVNE